MKKIFILILLLVTICSFSQELKDYKYVSIPTQFYFLKEADQYNLNTISKMFMEGFGYESYFENDQAAPKEFIDRNCGKLFLNVIENSLAFSTKVTIVLKNCNNKTIYTSNEGVSKEKDFKTAYTDAFRKAFISMRNIKKNPNEIVIESIVTLAEVAKKEVVSSNSDMIYKALLIPNGFELILDKKVDYTIFTTIDPKTFIAKSNYRNRNGILIKKEENLYYFQFIEDGILKTEFINIQF